MSGALGIAVLSRAPRPAGRRHRARARRQDRVPDLGGRQPACPGQRDSGAARARRAIGGPRSASRSRLPAPVPCPASIIRRISPPWPPIRPVGRSAPARCRCSRSTSTSPARGSPRGPAGRGACGWSSSTIPANGCSTCRCSGRISRAGPRRRCAAWRRPEIAPFARDFLAFARGLPARSPADETLAATGHPLYRAALRRLRDEAGLSFLQPGRFLMPAPGPEPPWTGFLPPRRRPGLAGLLASRYDAYCEAVTRDLVSPSVRPGGPARGARRHPLRPARRPRRLHRHGGRALRGRRGAALRRPWIDAIPFLR